MSCGDCGQISLFGPSKKYVAHYRIFLGEGDDKKSYNFDLENPSKFILEQWKKYYREPYEHEIRSPLEGEFQGGVKIEVSFKWL